MESDERIPLSSEVIKAESSGTDRSVYLLKRAAIACRCFNIKDADRAQNVIRQSQVPVNAETGEVVSTENQKSGYPTVRR